jgi:hypothetical protein
MPKQYHLVEVVVVEVETVEGQETQPISKQEIITPS